MTRFSVLFPFPLLIALLFAAAAADAATLPGFRVETLARTPGFVSSVVTDSNGTIYFSTTNGWIYRVDGNVATKVAALPTHAGGNGGLLGMALIDDQTAAVHYTTWNDETGEQAKVLDDVISRVDLRNGAETVLHAFACDIENRLRGASSEHHGGNLIVAPDGSIYVGIGEYGAYVIAQKPEWNAGKIWKIDPRGNATQWALGMRNPFDLAWDPENEWIVATDNGSEGGDEIHVIPEGSNCGWPYTYGNQPPVADTVAPAYVFANTVAPTGLQRLNAHNPILNDGYLVGAFVTRALYFMPRTFGEAIPVVEGFSEFVIDVTQSSTGDVIFATAMGATSSIHRLRPPLRGDCNGDGFTDTRDVLPLVSELEDGNPQERVRAQQGAHRSSWGCDANADGVIDTRDVNALRSLIGSGRRRAVRSR
ncbi:MAG TPA: PQQ-dependent sugar dehydrogenase [Thermoanaerobaculia bacterium]|jgi:glucose/arabinose dehydrogenase